MVSELVREFCQEPELVQHFKKIMSKGSEQTFKICKWSKHVNRCSTSWVIREIHFKITRHHFTSSRMDAIMMMYKNKCWWGCGAVGAPDTVGGHAVWCGHCGKQYGGSSEN